MVVKYKQMIKVLPGMSFDMAGIKTTLTTVAPLENGQIYVSADAPGGHKLATVTDPLDYRLNDIISEADRDKILDTIEAGILRQYGNFYKRLAADPKATVTETEAKDALWRTVVATTKHESMREK